MPKRTVWTAEKDSKIIEMRKIGVTWANIGRALGLERNTVIERGRRLGAKPATQAATHHPVSLRTSAPLPPGHQLTWGLISNHPYPGSGA